MRTLRLTRDHVDMLHQLVQDHDADEIRIARVDPEDEALTMPVWECDDQWLQPITVGLSRESDAHFDAVAEITHSGESTESVTTG